MNCLPARDREESLAIDSFPSIFACFEEGNSSPISANLTEIPWDSTAVVPNRKVVCHLTHLVVVCLWSSHRYFPTGFLDFLEKKMERIEFWSESGVFKTPNNSFVFPLPIPKRSHGRDGEKKTEWISSAVGDRFQHFSRVGGC